MAEQKGVPLGSVPRAGGSCKSPPTFKVHILQGIVLQVPDQRAATPAVSCGAHLGVRAVAWARGPGCVRCRGRGVWDVLGGGRGVVVYGGLYAGPFVAVGCGVGGGWRRVVVGMRAPPCAVVVGVWASGAAPFPVPVHMSSYRALGRALGHGVSD